jgi:hypothetical protein
MVQIKDGSFMHAPNHSMNVVISSNGQMIPGLVMMEDGVAELRVQHLGDRMQVGIICFQ